MWALLRIGAREGPAGVHTGQVQGPGKLAFEGRPAMGDRVSFEKAWRSFDFVGGLTNLDRRTQQRRGFSGGLSLDVILGLRRPQVAVDRRCRSSPTVPPAPPGCNGRRPTTSSPWRSNPSSWMAHRGSQILPTLPTRGGPNLLQHPDRVIGVLRRPPPTLPLRDPVSPSRAAGSLLQKTRRRRALSRDQPVTSTTASNTRALVLLRGLRNYALAYLVVTSARDVIDNPLLSRPTTLTVSRAFQGEARRAFRGQFS